MNYHILNGDSLAHQFPESINGTRLIARECLIDGPVQSSNLKQFYSDRATYIQAGFVEDVDYRIKSQSQFEEIQKAPKGSEFFLWFEDDLFCQTNFWFCLYLINLKKYRFGVLG